MTRYPTLVPTLRAVARIFVDDDSVVEDLALGVDHRLYRDAAQYEEHLVAWGTMFVARDAIDRVHAGASTELSPERLAALEALPTAALTVVVLRDGPGFSNDAISVAVQRPIDEVRWLGEMLEPQPLDVAPFEPEPLAPLPPIAEPEAVPPKPAAKREPAAKPKPTAEPATVLPKPTATPSAAIATPPTPNRPLNSRNQRRTTTAIAVVAAVAAILSVTVAAAALIGNDRTDRRSDTSGAQTSPGGAVTSSPSGPQLSTAACDRPNLAPTIPPTTLTLQAAAATNVATLRATAERDGPRPLMVVFIPPGTAAQDWLSTTTLEATADAGGAVLATLEAATPTWATPTGRELTPDVDAFAQLLGQIGQQVCVDPGAVSLIGFGDAGSFSTSIVCNYPTVASHSVSVGAPAPSDDCSRFAGRAMMALLDGAAPDYVDAASKYSLFAAVRHCPPTSQTNESGIALAHSQNCEGNSSFWIAAGLNVASWDGPADQLVARFLTETGALS